MRFNTHSNLAGTHAFLSASNYHWLNYDEDKLARSFIQAQAARRGTEMHALAHMLIRLGQRLPTTKQTFNMYVNDAIGYGMRPEMILFYSPNCYGTADCISFRRNTLRIHDLKTGEIQGSPFQLQIYAALFCFEYGYKPTDIQTELRIYQTDEVRVYETDPDVITHVMDRILTADRLIREMRSEAE